MKDFIVQINKNNLYLNQEIFSSNWNTQDWDDYNEKRKKYN